MSQESPFLPAAGPIYNTYPTAVSSLQPPLRYPGPPAVGSRQVLLPGTTIDPPWIQPFFPPRPVVVWTTSWASKLGQQQKRDIVSRSTLVRTGTWLLLDLTFLCPPCILGRRTFITTLLERTFAASPVAVHSNPTARGVSPTYSIWKFLPGRDRTRHPSSAAASATQRVWNYMVVQVSQLVVPPLKTQRPA